jgi:hypothetical protein
MMMRAQTDLKSMMLSVKPMLLNMAMVIIICNFVSRQTMARKAVMKFVQTTTALLPIIIQLRMMLRSPVIQKLLQLYQPPILMKMLMMMLKVIRFFSGICVKIIQLIIAQPSVMPS